PVRSSLAWTCKIPLASMRNVTSIFGIPAGIGSSARSSKRASERQSSASSRSPWTTCRSTTVCPSTDVVNISLALVGLVVLRGISARDLAVVGEPLERDRERRPLLRGQADLGRLGRQAQLLHRLAVAPEVDAVLGADVVEEPHDDRAVEVVATEVGVAVGREHLEDAVLHAQDRDVEGPAAEVVDGDDALLEAMEPIGERRRGRLVDDAHDVE